MSDTRDEGSAYERAAEHADIDEFREIMLDAISEDDDVSELGPPPLGQVDDERERSMLVGVKVKTFSREQDMVKLVARIDTELRLQFPHAIIEVWRME